MAVTVYGRHKTHMLLYITPLSSLIYFLSVIKINSQTCLYILRNIYKKMYKALRFLALERVKIKPDGNGRNERREKN